MRTLHAMEFASHIYEDVMASNFIVNTLVRQAVNFFEVKDVFFCLVSVHNLECFYCVVYRTLPLRLEFSPMSIFYWQMYLSQSAKPQWMQWMGEQQATDEEQDSFKETLLETNPYLLGLTVAVSLLHTVFEFLAFKNGEFQSVALKSRKGLIA